MDAGDSWAPLSLEGTELAFGGFGWYFSKIRVNPNNHEDIFLLGIDLLRKEAVDDEWIVAAPEWWTYEVHADKHDLFISDNSEDMFLATDGGLYRGNLNSSEWVDIENIPSTQFYGVGYNPHNPTWYYGGAQDNGTTGGNSSTINEWPRIDGGDGFKPSFHTENSLRFYTLSQRGNLDHTEDGGLTFQSGEGIDTDENVNWNMPYFLSVHHPDLVYCGWQKVYKSKEDGTPIWQEKSPVLTDDDPENLLPHYLSVLNESTITEELLFAGTADGNIFRRDTRNSDWLLLSEDLPVFYVSAIAPSDTIDSHIFASFSGYQTEVAEPMIFFTDDKGENWQSVAGDLPPLSINDIFVMPNYNDEVIFIASDYGVYVTMNKGENWERLGDNMPFIPCFDLELNPTENTLFAGTFARSIMSFDLEQIDIFSDYMPPVAIQESGHDLLNQIQVYPNPSSEQIRVKFSNREKGKNTELVVLDLQGKSVIKKNLGNQEIQNVELDISQLPAGQYVVKVKFRHTVLSKSFVKVN